MRRSSTGSSCGEGREEGSTRTAKHTACGWRAPRAGWRAQGGWRQQRTGGGRGGRDACSGFWSSRCTWLLQNTIGISRQMPCTVVIYILEGYFGRLSWNWRVGSDLETHGAFKNELGLSTLVCMWMSRPLRTYQRGAFYSVLNPYDSLQLATAY